VVKINFKLKLFDTHIDKIGIALKKTIIKSFSLHSFDDRYITECLKYLSNEKEIKNLLSANVEQLRLYIDFFTKEFPSSVEKNSPLNKILREEIFEKEYGNWGGRKTYGAYAFVKALGLNSCPYCNRNYTFVVDSENGKLRPEIDHFYPKSVYPFLAMSFFNLIPSCPICNHTKSDKVKENLENPYEIESNSYKFTYRPTTVEFAVVKKEKYDFENFEIEINGNKANIELFKLEELYKQHKDIVLELLTKKAYYPQSYIEELSRFGFSQDEIYRYLFSNYSKEKDLHKRPLSKLIKDISTELGII